MRIFTIQVGKWRLAKSYDIFFLDTTVKSGYSLFAPNWDMVMGYKNGTVSEDEYKKLYRELLIRSWTQRREEWMKFLQDDTPTALACYCKPGLFCHRLLLKDFLRQLCKQLEIQFEYFGELIDDSSAPKV
jgi:uncharacterized protein YeaO (DUF488 family)